MSGRANTTEDELAGLDRLRLALRHDLSPESVAAMQGELAEFLRWLRRAQTSKPELVCELEGLHHLSEDELKVYFHLRQETWVQEAMIRLARLFMPVSEPNLLAPAYRTRQRLADEALSLKSHSGTGNSLGTAELDFRAHLLAVEDFMRDHGIPAGRAREAIAKVCGQFGWKDVTAEALAGAWYRQFKKLPPEDEAESRGEFSPRKVRRTVCASLHHCHDLAILSGSIRPEAVAADMVQMVCAQRPHPELEKIAREHKKSADPTFHPR